MSYKLELTAPMVRGILFDLETELEKCQEMLVWRGISIEDRELFTRGAEDRRVIIDHIKESCPGA